MKKVISVMLVLLLLITGCGGNYDAKYEEGLKYLNEGNYEQAIVCFTEAIKIDSKQYPAYVGRGQAYLYSNQPEEAVKDYYSATNLGLGAGEVPKEIVNDVARILIEKSEEEGKTKEEILELLKEKGFFDEEVIANIDDTLVEVLIDLINEYSENGKSLDELYEFFAELGFISDGSISKALNGSLTNQLMQNTISLVNEGNELEELAVKGYLNTDLNSISFYLPETYRIDKFIGVLFRFQNILQCGIVAKVHFHHGFGNQFRDLKERDPAL